MDPRGRKRCSVTMFFHDISTPIGRLTLVSNGQALCGVHFTDYERVPRSRSGWVHDESCLREAITALAAYFAGDRREFDLALMLPGSVFETRVWAIIRRIPFGGTTTYGEIARRLGAPAAARAVGRAAHRNPVPIVIPCHRVVGADRSLTGYGGGLYRKRWLLGFEQQQLGCQRELFGPLGP